MCHQWLAPLVASALLVLFSSAGSADIQTKPQLAIVIDDIGYNRNSAHDLIALQYSLTFSVLPQSPYGKELAQLAWLRGKEVMLHIPMATQSNTRLDPGGIPLTMPTNQITELLTSHLTRFPQASGINNHMGSRLTELSPAMDAVMRALKTQNLYFIDSRTSAQSVAFTQAKKAGLQAASRDIFLDNQPDVDAIKVQLKKAAALAERNGSALAIGHPYPETYAALKALLPELLTRVEVVPSSTYLRGLSHNQREAHHSINKARPAKGPWVQGSAK